MARGIVMGSGFAKPLFAWSYNASSAEGQRGRTKRREKPG
jgi:hypothetical protein